MRTTDETSRPAVPGLVIRAAREGDLPAVLTLYAQPDMDDGTVLEPAQARRLFARMGRVPDHTLYVAELDGTTVGTFTLLIMHNLGHQGTPSGVLEDIVVATGRQGRGIGRALVAEALRLCRDRGCYKMTLSSNLQRTRAHAFYDSLGLERHGYSFRVDLAPRQPD